MSIGESPKPKGPRQIWEYEEENTLVTPSSEPYRNPSISSIDYKSQQRGYQQISSSRSKSELSSATTPYPTEDSSPATTSGSSEKTTPYPTDNFEDSILENNENDLEYSHNNSWQSHSRTDSINSFSRNDPQIPPFPVNQSPISSPPRPDLRFLPSKSSQNFFITKTSPKYQPGDYSSDSSFSRSPSPTRRTVDRTHTVSSGFTYRESEYASVNDGYNEFDYQQGPRATYNPIHDNLFYEDDVQLISDSPATEYFDYSMLPELPSVKPPPPPPTSSSSALASHVPASKQEEDLPSLPLELPELPFSSAFLQSQHFEICTKIWSISELFKWCLKLRIWLRNSTISKTELKKALGGLLAFHRRDVPLDVVSSNAAIVFENFVSTGAIEIVEDVEAQGNDKTLIIMNENVYLNGVLPLLTECYSNFEHTKEVEASNMTCYSSICTLSKSMNLERKMRNTNIKDIVLENDWTSHWHLTVEDIKAIDHSISKKQSLIFDLLRYEQTFIQRAKCFVEVVAPEFIKAAKNYLGKNSSKIKNFEQDVISTGKQIIEIHETILFEPLLKILIAEGRFIKNLVDIGQIYSDWTFEIKQPLIKYMSCMPMIEELLSIDTLKAYVDNQIGNLARVKELKVNVAILFISTFNSRYLQLPLQLADIYKKYNENDPEFISMSKAADAIRKLGSRINDSKKIADNLHAISIIKDQLIWKSGVPQINLNLNSPNRRFICRGDLTRRSDLKKLQTSNLDHIILLDNYMLITDRAKNRHGSMGYKIVEDPIPIEYLIVSSPIKTTNTISSGKSATTTDATDDDTDAFQFKIRYAGRSKRAYTFSCKSETERKDWINYLVNTKASLWKKLRNSNTYKVELVSNTVFGYDVNNRVTKLPLLAPYDPIYDVCDDSVAKIKKLNLSKDIYNPQLSRNRIVFSKVQCLDGFEYKGSKYNLVGVESGLYMCEAKGRWKKILGGADYGQIQVDSEIGIVVILHDKHLRYYPIHQMINVYSGGKSDLSGIALSKDSVLFFKMGRHKNAKMLFYAKKKSNGTIHFKVVIPQTDNAGIFSRFKDHARFYIEAECYGISIFNSSFAVQTNKGFEIMEIDKLIPTSVPELPLPIDTDKKKPDPYATRKSNAAQSSSVETIRKLLNANYKPMGMFKLNNNKEFLLVYKEYAIFINKHGKPSRDTIIHFKAQYVHFENNNLFAVNDQLIEVWNIGEQPKKAQVIIGKDIRGLGGNGFSMANPLVPGLQLVFRLIE
ncbi:TUS1 Rho1 guanine nucleotide exchange factor TUS1 [Candida maltosa Xu316]